MVVHAYNSSTRKVEVVFSYPKCSKQARATRDSASKKSKSTAGHVPCSRDTCWPHTKPSGIAVQSIFRHCPGPPGKPVSSAIFVENGSFKINSGNTYNTDNTDRALAYVCPSFRTRILVPRDRPLHPKYLHSVRLRSQKGDSQTDEQGSEPFLEATNKKVSQEEILILGPCVGSELEDMVGTCLSGQQDCLQAREWGPLVDYWE